MRFLLRLSSGVLFAALACTTPCAAQSEPGAAPQSAEPDVGTIIIDTVAQRILHDYYARNAQAWVVAHPDEDWADQDGSGQGSGKKDKHKDKHKDKKHKSLPPGIAKKGTLPPGIAKQLVRNGHLPPGLEYRALPPDLIVQLPPLAPAYRYVIADDRVMLIRAATNVIIDILQVPGL
jgi:hypothetical protein